MNYIQTVKAVRINKDALKELQKAVATLAFIKTDLEEIVSEDDYYRDLLNDATFAWANLSDFLDNYETKRE